LLIESKKEGEFYLDNKKLEQIKNKRSAECEKCYKSYGNCCIKEDPPQEEIVKGLKCEDQRR